MKWEHGPSETLPGLLAKAVATWPGNMFLESQGERLTYRDFDTDSTSLAHGLREIGVKKGDTVVVLLDNSLEMVVVLFALAKLGAISVPMNTALKGEFLRHQVHDSRATVVICESPYISRLLDLESHIPGVKTVLCRGELPTVTGRLRPVPMGQIKSGDRTAVEDDVAPTDLAMLCYTSGTTGPSKGCMIGHNYICNFARHMAWALSVRENDITSTSLPLFHKGALGVTVLSALCTGAAVSIYPRFSLSNFWPEIERSKATIAIATASMAPLVAEAPETEAARRCFGQLRLVAGVPFSAVLVDKWRSRFGVRDVGAPGYGMTEMQMLALHPLSEPSPPGSSGKRHADFDVRVRDANGNECPPGVAGEVLVRPRRPGIMFAGYWNRPEETLKVFEDLWFHTGDIGRFDENDFFFFVDRKKDYIRRRGENVSSYEVETAFRAHPDVEDVAAHAVASNLSEDEVKVTVMLKAGARLSEEELCRWSLDQLPFFAVPRYIEFRSSLPLNQSGKVLKYELRAQGVTPTTWDREMCPSIVIKR